MDYPKMEKRIAAIADKVAVTRQGKSDYVSWSSVPRGQVESDQFWEGTV